MTRTGWTVTALGVLLCIAGALLGYPDLAALGALLLVVVAGALLVTWRRPAMAAVREVTPPAVTRGENAGAALVVTNEGRWPTLSAYAVDLVGTRRVDVAVPRLAAGATVSTSYDLPAHRRGVVQIGPLSIVRSDPFSIVRRERPLDGIAHLYVRPKVHLMRAPEVGRARAVEGGETDRALEGSTTFHSLREYVPGDDRRRVHWRTTARTGQLMVKQHIDLTRPEALVLVDVDSASGSDDQFEEAVDVVASLVAAILRTDSPVQLITTLGEAENLYDRDAVERMLDVLAAVDRTAQDKLPTLESVLSGRSGSVAAIVTAGEITPWIERGKPLLRRFGAVTVIGFTGDAAVGRTADVVHVTGADASQAVGLWNAQVTL